MPAGPQINHPVLLVNGALAQVTTKTTQTTATFRKNFGYSLSAQNVPLMCPTSTMANRRYTVDEDELVATLQRREFPRANSEEFWGVMDGCHPNQLESEKNDQLPNPPKDASSPKPGHKRQRSHEAVIEPELEITFIEEEPTDGNADQAGAALAIGNEDQEETEESTGDYSTPHNLSRN